MTADDSADRQGVFGGPLRAPVRRMCAVLAFVTAVVIGFIVFTPGKPDADGQQSLQHWLDRMHELHRLPDFVTFDVIEFASNSVMFVPICFLLAGALRPPSRRWVVPVAVLVSIGIELVQHAALPVRTATVSDVIANAVGAAVGVLLLAIASRRAPFVERHPDQSRFETTTL